MLWMRRQQDPKFVYYLSAEFLMGRSLTNAVYNLGIDGAYGDAVRQMGYKLEELVDAEQNAVSRTWHVSPQQGLLFRPCAYSDQIADYEILNMQHEDADRDADGSLSHHCH